MSTNLPPIPNPMQNKYKYKYNYLDNPDYPIYVSDKTIQLTPQTFMEDHLWEHNSLKYFYSLVPRDKPVNIVDIGAQSGLYSLFAKYLPLSTFYAFEPYPPTYRALLENLQLNKITNVIPHNIGISDKAEETTLNVCIGHNGLHTLGTTPLRFQDACPTSIQVDTLDHLFYDKNIPVDFIKIDCEGWEYFILQGGLKTIQKYKPIIEIEWNDYNMKQCGVTPYKMNELITTTLKYIKFNIIGEELFIGPMTPHS